jgi:hypothetical protein
MIKAKTKRKQATNELDQLASCVFMEAMRLVKEKQNVKGGEKRW